MLGGAAAIWVGALGGTVGVLSVATLSALICRGKRVALIAVMATLAVGGLLSAELARSRSESTLAAPLPVGLVTVEGIVRSDGAGLVSFQPVQIGVGIEGTPWHGPRLGVDTQGRAVMAGDQLRVTGSIYRFPGYVGGYPVAGRMAAEEVRVIGGPTSPLFRLGNAIRSRVVGQLTGRGSSGALISGFLIGDVSGLHRADVEALRRSGLSHFVAVSGSNVALFLGALWLASGPIGWGPRRRALLGLVGLVVFVVVTRWEPSVVRASVMAAMVLGGRLGGLWVPPWAALGGAAAVLLLIAGDLATNVGFQLSVLATAGVLTTVGLWRERKPRWLWAGLAATIGAQAAVAPLLIWHFGSIPVVAPLANLVAAPVVAAATMVGMVAVATGSDAVAGAATGLGALVLGLARKVAVLPQLGVYGSVLLGASATMTVHHRSRPFGALAIVLVVGWTLFPAPWPSGPEVRFLDVGQGDASIVRGPDGEVILVDGGPDPIRLASYLRDLGVRRIDLLITSHRHDDHIAGLDAVVGRIPVTILLRPPLLERDDSSALDMVDTSLRTLGTITLVAEPGDRLAVGSLEVEVLAPLRRYVSPNDGSVVVRITASGHSVLFTGDIETFAQADLGPLKADVMKVPHQGGATSDLQWLRESTPSVAVISVGRNDFGHPDRQVIETLESAGAQVHRTDLEGTITIRLDRLG